MEEESKTEKLSYKDKLKFANEISKPMAPKGTTKRLLKLVKKGKARLFDCYCTVRIFVM